MAERLIDVIFEEIQGRSLIPDGMYLTELVLRNGEYKVISHNPERNCMYFRWDMSEANENFVMAAWQRQTGRALSYAEMRGEE